MNVDCAYVCACMDVYISTHSEHNSHRFKRSRSSYEHLVHLYPVLYNRFMSIVNESIGK